MIKKWGIGIVAVGLFSIIYFIGTAFASLSDKEYRDTGEVALGFLDIALETWADTPLVLWPGGGEGTDGMIEYRLINNTNGPVIGRIFLEKAGLYTLPEIAGKDLLLADGSVIPAGTRLISSEKDAFLGDYLLTQEGLRYGKHIGEDYVAFMESQKAGNGAQRPLYLDYYQKEDATSGLYSFLQFERGAFEAQRGTVVHVGDDFLTDPHESSFLDYGMPAGSGAALTIQLKIGVDKNAGNQLAYGVIVPSQALSAKGVQPLAAAYKDAFGAPLEDGFQKDLADAGILKD